MDRDQNLKLFFTPASPYTRKVTSVAIVTGLADRIERIAAVPHPIDRDAAVVASNPLGKVPTLVTADGLTLFDSRVIVEYLDAHSVGARVLPVDPVARWRALTLQALADGILDAALLARYELTARPEDLRWSLWVERQFDKVNSALDQLSAQPAQLGLQFDIGTISIASALGYLDLRFSDFDWRNGRVALSDWFSAYGQNDFFLATAPTV